MKGQKIKKYQQKELNMMCRISKKTRNYIFSLPRDKSRENWRCKNELIFYFRGQNETGYHRISILLLSLKTFEKTPENEGERHNVKTNLKRRNQIISSPRDEIIQRNARKMKVVHQKDTKKGQLFWDKSYFNCVNLVPT